MGGATVLDRSGLCDLGSITFPSKAEINDEHSRPFPNPSNRRAVEPPKVAWRVKEWRQAVGLGTTKTHALIRDKRIDSVMLDGARLITTSPEAFIDKMLAVPDDAGVGGG